MNEYLSYVRDALWENLKMEVNISYILKDSHGSIQAVFYDPSGAEGIMGALGQPETGLCTYPIQEWDFNVDDYLLCELEHGYEIVYMPIIEHYNVWCAIDDCRYDINHEKGLQEYLKYCQKHDITPASIDSLGLNHVNIMDLYKEENQGYKIVAVQSINDTSYVIGHNPKAPDPYVVWKTSTNRQNGYDIGHYFESFDKAFDNFRSRVQDEVEKQICLKQKRYKNKEKRQGAR